MADQSFVGWNTAADGSGVTYQPGETLTMPDNDVTLYAMWHIVAETRSVTDSPMRPPSVPSPRPSERRAKVATEDERAVTA